MKINIWTKNFKNGGFNLSKIAQKKGHLVRLTLKKSQMGANYEKGANMN